MKIYTTNKDGKRVLVEYSQTIIEEPEAKPEIIINDYETFRKCIQKSQEQKKFVNGSKVYDVALAELVQRDHALYVQFTNKLSKELSRK